MHIRLIAAGTRMPGWVTDGYQHYANRLPRAWAFELVEIPLGRRGRSLPPEAARREEGQRMLAGLRGDARVIALDVTGKAVDTPGLADWLTGWQRDGRNVALLVGGPEGLAPDCVARAERRWSLSPLTLPHALVRVLVAEALYRAASLNANHPYHR